MPSMEDKEFEKIVKKAVKDIPEEFVEKLENVDIFIQDWPNTHQVENLRKKGHGKGLVFGLYEGIPQTRRARYGLGGPLPDKITIFKVPTLMVSKSYNELVRNVQDTVIHEIGHHFGMNEKEIANAMKVRRQSVNKKK